MDGVLKRRIDAYLETHFEGIIGELGELVEIPSVSRPGEDGLPFGRECARVLERALELARQKGLEARNWDNWYGTAKWGSGAYHVGIFTHLDVVEAGENWFYPPYQCTEKDGWLIGRGVGDDKLAAIIGIYALCAARDLGLAPNSRFTVFFGCGEETGMSDLDRYLSEQNQPDLCLVPDIRFPVCVGEKGSIRFSLSRPFSSHFLLRLTGGNAPNVVPARAGAVCVSGLAGGLAGLVACKKHLAVQAVPGCGETELTAAGAASSASMPWRGINAVGLITSELAGWHELPPEDRAMMARCANLAAHWDGGALGVARQDECSGPLTCTCVGLAGGGGTLCLDFDLRYPITCDGEGIARQVEEFARREGWNYTQKRHSPPHRFSPDDPDVQLLCRCWEEVAGKREKPFVIGGGTYARKLGHALGFGPDDGSVCPFLPEGHGGIHGPDEARSIQTIRRAARAYLYALCMLDEAQDNTSAGS